VSMECKELQEYLAATDRHMANWSDLDGGIVPVRIKTANKVEYAKSGGKRLKNCSGGFNDNSDTIFYNNAHSSTCFGVRKSF